MDLAMSDDEDDDLPFKASFALHDAVETGETELVEQVFAAAKLDRDFDPSKPEVHRTQADINELDDSECTPIHIAILKGHVAIVQLLIEKGADLEKATEGSPPLHAAVCTASLPNRKQIAHKIVALLLGAKAATLSRDDNGRTALHWAAVLGDTQIAELLWAEHEIQVTEFKAKMEDLMQTDEQNLAPSLTDAQDKQGNTALHLAASNCHVSMVDLILKRPGGKACIDSLNKSNQNALHCASAQGASKSAIMLHELDGSLATKADKFQKAPSDWALQGGFQALARYLQNPSEETRKEALLDENVSQGPTLILAPEACREHRTFPEPFTRDTWAHVPPENVCRLRVLTDPEEGILRTEEFGDLQWDETSRFAPLADILRVHDWPYVLEVQAACAVLPDEPGAVGHLDSDTALSHGSIGAALAGVGACCRAVDQIMKGSARNAFCAIRPPGHHAGPLGAVPSEVDPHGSQGFCFFNNIAIAAAYAVNVYRHQGIRRVALLDFDVHHGNGTEACMGRLVPQTLKYGIRTPLCQGQLSFKAFNPWLNADDNENFLFASVQGYGSKGGELGGHIYPGSGATCDTKLMSKEELCLQDPIADLDGLEPSPTVVQTSLPNEESIPEDPDREFQTGDGQHPAENGPRIINVGIPGPGAEVSLWRRAWRDKILPAVADFKPDFIIVSAGFDAHRKDILNHKYIGVTERDYYWVTQQIVALSNKVCNGRLVSALEGGYRIQGGIVSAFSRSVAAHVKALSENSRQVWSTEESRKERQIELQRRRELLIAKQKSRALAAQRAIERERQILASQEAQIVPKKPEPLGEDGLPVVPPSDTATSPIEAPSDSGPQIGAQIVNGTSHDRKRRRKAVDYTALEEQLKQEEAGKLSTARKEVEKLPVDKISPGSN